MRFVIPVLLLLFGVCALAAVPTDSRPRPVAADPGVAERRAQGETTANLSWIDAGGVAARTVNAPLTRADLIRERAERTWAGDSVGTARVNSVFAAEAFRRSKMVLDRWYPRFDPGTGLMPTSIEADGALWAYGDTGSDLYPHLAIATHLLAPENDHLFTNLLERERKLTPAVPDDVSVPGGQPKGLSLKDRIFGVAEYAKDGLLPMVDRLGRDPWLGRLVEVTDALLAASETPTRRHGMIPADSTEVNGDVLQVLSRVYWATGDPKYLEAASRIGRTYIQEMFPTTQYLPSNRWNFLENEPLDRRRFRLSDHGNEILPGLMEWHLAATLAGDPEAETDRLALRRMLDRLAEKGRDPSGLWLRVIEIPSGRVEQEGLTDTWGYVSQAFLIGSLVESIAPGGDAAAAQRYHEIAARSLGALPRWRFYEWEQGKMDGYADAIESAVYILNEVQDPAAENWVDDQIGVLYGFQAPDGAVVERDLDGNFVRTSLINAYRLTGGARLDPWSPDTLIGGARENGCLVLWATSGQGWQGKLVIDRPRHRDYYHMPYDYPRLNKWPQWFTADAGQSYRVSTTNGPGTASAPQEVSGQALIDGVPLELPAGQERVIRVCGPSGQ